MYKVLLVDDEELDLEGMKRFIPWEKLGMEVTGAANNALSAREIIEKQPIDILVSDVNMPYMSGLELARTALERSPDLRVIFVSGYQEFSYVRQALSMKAYNYVLKPMEDEELVETLRTVKRDLDEANKQREVERSYERMIPLAKSELLNRLLEVDGVPEEEGEGGGRLLGAYELDRLRWPVRVAVVEPDKWVWDAKSADTGQEAVRRFMELAPEEIRRQGFAHYCKVSPHRFALLIEEAELASFEAAHERIGQALRSSATAGLGEPVLDLTGLPVSYRQAVQAAEAKLFAGKGRIIRYEEVRRDPGMVDVRTLEARTEEWLRAIADFEPVRVHDELEGLFRMVASSQSAFSVRHLANYLVWKLELHLTGMNENLFKLLEMEQHQLDELHRLDTVDEVRSWLLLRSYEVGEKLRDKSSATNGKFMRSVVALMKERLGENLTLKDFSKHFPFSASYFGFLIKEKSGQTFGELLTGLRMERACELLKEPGIKIYEVADQVGYRYLPYFSRQFKEKFGMTPLEYRKKEQ